MYTTLTYMIYTILSLLTTVWVARTLFKNGRIFLIDSFSGNKEMADAVNTLLMVGFYLVNIGFVTFFLRFGEKPSTLIESIEYISTKMGVVLFFLGVAHMFNVFNFGRMRRKAQRRKLAEQQFKAREATQTATANATS
mgnify:CR=1 FL=1